MNMFKISIGMLVLMLFVGCGSSCSGDSSDSVLSQVEIPETFECEADQFFRIKTNRCVKLKHPDWGFRGFATDTLPTFKLKSCTQEALLALLEEVPASGGRVVLPACTIEMDDVIVLHDNMIFEGAGMDKTLIRARNSNHDMLSLQGKNIIVRGIGFDGTSNALGGIVGTNNRGNILIERVAIRDLRGSGIYLETAQPQADAKITVRLCRISQTLHGIVVKMRKSAKMLFYSNELYANREYGIDMSTTSDIEVSGNYMHDNYYAGAKSPLADRIYYYQNDINHNGKDPNREDRAGIVYMGTNPTASIYIEKNDLRDNGGLAYASWDAHFAYLLLRDNLVTGSEDRNGYNIRATGIDKIDVYGDHGKIWVGEGNEGRVVYH
jgi:hypothetical protein